ncbi:Hachiman antiphage defense system protein HamA [Brevundimonas sp.]|uniref:Hachiman antiphage defense system protein HamA n=1 Tax=Brevundimonas sp. TaxID=1871086 RepID=UPI003564CC75
MRGEDTAEAPLTTPKHLSWLVDSGTIVPTACGKAIPVWELQHVDDAAILSDWASHFRRHYCSDEDLEALTQGTGKTKAEFLREMKLPSLEKPGPSVRSGDFGEILIADYLRYVLGHWSPAHIRYDGRFNPNDPTKGADIIGFSHDPDVGHLPADELYLFEAKSGMTLSKKNRLQDAVDDSGKDKLREAVSLNAFKQRLRKDGDETGQKIVQRFQDETARPFARRNGAAAIMDDDVFAATDLTKVDASLHPNAANLSLMVIKGPSLMALVHALYERAADEA